MIHDVFIAYWPVWLFALGVAFVVLEAWALCRMGAAADDTAQRALDEQAARKAVRPSPAPIDITLVDVTLVRSLDADRTTE